MKSTRSTIAGFSMIEMIGVLAVMAIVAAILAPPALRKITEANGTREALDLETLGAGLVDYVKVYQAVPGGTSWATNIAGVIGKNAEEVLYLRTTDTNSARVFLVHPGFTPSTGTEPVLTNTSAGFSAPTNARVMILSTTRSSLTLPVSSGKAADTAGNRQAFEDIWEWNHDHRTDDPPAGWPSEWAGNGNHLRVERVNLGPYFYHVTFSNEQFPTNIPFGRFNALPTVAYSVTNAIDAFYLHGTTIRLYKHDDPYSGPPATPDELDVVHVAERDVNFSYGGSPSRWWVP